jgi:hypothetical protein
MKDIEIYSEMYKLLGIDEIYFISKSGLKFISLTSRSNILPCIAETGLEFTEHLNKLVNTNQHGSRFLSLYWNYQVLINDGKVEQITQQPLDNYVATMLKETKNIKAVKHLGLKDDTLIWTPSFLQRTIKLARDVYFYRLHPNMLLKKHLFKKD